MQRKSAPGTGQHTSETKPKKGKTTVWVHKEYARKYYAENETEPISVSERDGVRKYSPASYIKKYMKGYFDIAIFDECHVCKDGDSAQGNAMHCLIKATKKQLALTGTHRRRKSRGSLLPDLPAGTVENDIEGVPLDRCCEFFQAIRKSGAAL